MKSEFSRPVDADTVSETPRRVEIGADETERRRLAGRFRLKGIERLSAEVTLSRRAGVIHADGIIHASVLQACVVTDEPLPAEIDAPFAVRFVSDAFGAAGEDEVELSAEDCDTLPLENGRIDLGELAAETLALSLDPYPRSAAADVALAKLGAAGDHDGGTFAALKALKDQFERR